MLNIINDIINISKIESGQMPISITDTDINEQIEYVHSFFKVEVEQKGIQLIVKNSSTNNLIIKTDKEKVSAVLVNLVKNAIKFTYNGSIEFGYKLKNNFIEFFVKDTGVGISSELINLIFERFRQGSESLTRNYEGSGLGLSISKAYVEMLGGKIWVESEFGVGSVFYFTIPNNEIEKNINVVTKIEVPDKKNALINNLKILIAEDDETSEMFITNIIELFGKKIMCVKTGYEAIETCQNNPDIDLVLMDVKMPEMDGYEATRQIRKFNKKVIIIAQTAFGLLGEKEKAIAAGCNDYISKPINQEVLIELIKTHIIK